MKLINVTRWNTGLTYQTADNSLVMSFSNEIIHDFKVSGELLEMIDGQALQTQGWYVKYLKSENDNLVIFDNGDFIRAEVTENGYLLSVSTSLVDTVKNISHDRYLECAEWINNTVHYIDTNRIECEIDDNDVINNFDQRMCHSLFSRCLRSMTVSFAGYRLTVTDNEAVLRCNDISYTTSLALTDKFRMYKLLQVIDTIEQSHLIQLCKKRIVDIKDDRTVTHVKLLTTLITTGLILVNDRIGKYFQAQDEQKLSDELSFKLTYDGLLRLYEELNWWHDIKLRVVDVKGKFELISKHGKFVIDAAPVELPRVRWWQRKHTPTPNLSEISDTLKTMTEDGQYTLVLDDSMFRLDIKKLEGPKE